MKQATQAAGVPCVLGVRCFSESTEANAAGLIRADPPRAAFACWHRSQIIAVSPRTTAHPPAGGVQGRTCTAYPACGPEVSAAGGLMRDVDAAEVVVDGNLVG